MFETFRGKTRQPLFSPQLPRGQRVYAIGDLHGRADLLKQMHALIRRDAAADQPRQIHVVYLGDYIDRGPYVQETIDEVLTGLGNSFAVTQIRGNHEQMLLLFLDDASFLPLWLELGGLATLMSYGVYPGHSHISKQRAADLREEFLGKLPEEHVRFFQNLSYRWRMGDYLFVHAGIHPLRAPEFQTTDDLLWIRDEFVGVNLDLDFTVVHGHTFTRKPEVQPCRIGIDTGAYATGNLTCAVLEADRIRFLDTLSAQ